jgi:alginate O-acetyltransferase complex protein AlgI
MVFSSVSFLFYFVPIFFMAYFCLSCKNLVVLIFSIAFYAWGEPRFLPIILFYIIINYVSGLLIGRHDTMCRAWVANRVAGNLGLLIYFKYVDFFSAQISHIAVQLGLGATPVANVPLPLGISFITFQGLSYVIDVSRGTVQPQRSLLKFAMYKSMFPQLIAGPIVRYKEIAADIDSRPVRMDALMDGARQFIVGLAQKVLIANVLASPADQIFALHSHALDTTTAWLGIACYTLQIYFDFAGYSNMAIGLGRMIGFHYPINFIRPYAAVSVTDFWHRWHMTLSRWFLDYLYIPLGGNRISSGRTYVNLMIVFLLCGFWHGANWTFLIWGAYHGAFLVIERLGFGKVLRRLWLPLRHLYLILVVMIGWVFFRCDSLNSAARFLFAMMGFGAGSPLTVADRYLTNETFIALWAGALLATIPAWHWLVVAERHLRSVSARVVGVGGAHALLLLMLLLCLLEVAGGAYNPFIYYRF